jgi:hypothetical protein
MRRSNEASTANGIRIFAVEGAEVHCHQLENRRVWTCTCDYFVRRRGRTDTREAGYCPHIALAIMQAIEDATIGSVD